MSIAGPYIFVIGEGFLVDTSLFSGSDSAWPLRSSPADMFELSRGAMRLAAAYDLDRTLTLRWARSPVWSGGVMLLLKSWPTDFRPHPLRAALIIW